MLTKFSGLNPKGRYVSLEKEKQNFRVVLTYSIKRAREIRKFHIAVVQQRLRNKQKSVSTCKDVFRQSKPIVSLLFSVAVAKTPYKVVLIQKFCYHGNVTSHFSSLLNINLIFSWLLRRHIRTPRFVFLLSSTNNFHVRETLLVVNLQEKVAPSHIGANHLRSHERMLTEDLGDSIELSEIKKK